MDTTAEYVAMSDWPEIQAAWATLRDQWSVSMWRIADDELVARPLGEPFDATIVGHHVGLLRQDQLQEMAGGMDAQALVAEYLSSTIDLGFEPASWEQLWLALVMHEKHGKHWNGGAWECQQ